MPGTTGLGSPSPVELLKIESNDSDQLLYLNPQPKTWWSGRSCAPFLQELPIFSFFTASVGARGTPVYRGFREMMSTRRFSLPVHFAALDTFAAAARRRLPLIR